MFGGESVAMLYARAEPSGLHTGEPLQYSPGTRTVAPDSRSIVHTDDRPCASRRSTAAVLPSGDSDSWRNAADEAAISATPSPLRSIHINDPIARCCRGR